MITQEQKRARGRERTDRYRARLEEAIRFRFQVPSTARRISDWIARGALDPDAVGFDSSSRKAASGEVPVTNCPAGRPK